MIFILKTSISSPFQVFIANFLLLGNSAEKTKS